MPALNAGSLYRLSQTLARHQILLDPPETLLLFERLLDSLAEELKMPLDEDLRTCMLLHLVLSRKREQPETLSVKMEAREYIAQHLSSEFALCLRAVQNINRQLRYPLYEEEAYNLLGIFENIDIFINIGAHISSSCME